MAATQYPHDDIHQTIPVLAPGHTYKSITDKLTGIVLTKHTPLVWFPITAIAFSLLMCLQVALVWLIANGIGIWGNNVPVGWAFDSVRRCV